MRLKLFRRFAAFAAAVALLVTASAGSSPAALAGGDSGAQGIARAIAAQEAHTDALFGIEGVVGTGVGLGARGRAVVFVFTESAGVSGIPGKLDGVTVVPQITGKIVALHHRDGHCDGPPGSELPPGCGGGDPTLPGITVNPTSGLVTTEAGGTDTFTVALDTLPSADVTIGLSSSDTTEGTVSAASLTFTPTNGTTPRIVTVTGVDDLIVDGNIVYTILTASAVSSDTDYNGLNAANVSVTNLDNDGVIEFDRPANIGTSSGTERLISGEIDGEPAAFCTTGTLGARVKSGSNVFALSNAHVYALEGSTPIGDVSTTDRILQPGRVDLPTGCGTAAEITAAKIGNLAAWVPLQLDPDPSDNVPGPNNTVDAAVASTTTLDVGVATPLDGYGTPSADTLSVDELFFRQSVVKYGRTTGLTEGKVWAINVTVNVGYDNGVARFVGQIAIRGNGFSAGGDSGSLVVTKSGNNPVGLLFAGGGRTTFLNPIDDVLAELSTQLGGGATLAIDGS